MDVAEVITKMHRAGFTLAANADRLSVSPSDRLTDTQRQFIRDHKPDIIAALKSPGAILDGGQSGNDIAPANDERVTVHVPELVLSNGSKISCDLDVPARNLDKLRAVIRFTLKDEGGGGSLLGSPGKSEAELKDILREKYGSRLATIDGQPAPIPDRITPITCKDISGQPVKHPAMDGEILDGEFVSIVL